MSGKHACVEWFLLSNMHTNTNGPARVADCSATHAPAKGNKKGDYLAKPSALTVFRIDSVTLKFSICCIKETDQPPSPPRVELWSC